MALLSWASDVVEKLEKVWEETTLEESHLPEGQYEVRVNEANIVESKNGKKMLSWEFVVDRGVHTGKKIKKFSLMETEDNIRYLKRDLLRAGVNPKHRLTEMQKDVDELVDRNLLITLKNNKNDKYQQVWIDSENVPF
jgi:hypothetical protein